MNTVLIIALLIVQVWLWGRVCHYRVCIIHASVALTNLTKLAESHQKRLDALDGKGAQHENSSDS